MPTQKFGDSCVGSPNVSLPLTLNTLKGQVQGHSDCQTVSRKGAEIIYE